MDVPKEVVLWLDLYNSVEQVNAAQVLPAKVTVANARSVGD